MLNEYGGYGWGEKENASNPSISSGYSGCVCRHVETLVLLPHVRDAIHLGVGSDTAYDIYAL